MVSALPAVKQNTGADGGMSSSYHVYHGMSDLSETAAAHCVLSTELHATAENNRTNKHRFSLSPLPAEEDRIQLELSAFL